MPPSEEPSAVTDDPTGWSVEPDGSALSPIATVPTPTPAAQMSKASPPPEPSVVEHDDYLAAQMLVRHLFSQATRPINGLHYDVAYRHAARTVGGDIVDVFHYDNGAAAFSVADIAGKGTQAAVSAAMIKYGLRATISQGFTAESVLRALDRLMLENNAFEGMETFASVFLAIIDESRGALTYASAGHEPVILAGPDGSVRVLPPTAPLVGVFDDQHHLFRQRVIQLQPGTLLVAATDGVTEARTPGGEFYGMDRFAELIAAHADAPVSALPGAIIAAVEAFSAGALTDDIGIFALRNGLG
jgi:serine phosphatase RsbU (regulator of sigma subunit)